MRDDKTKGPFGNNLVFSIYFFIFLEKKFRGERRLLHPRVRAYQGLFEDL